MNIFVAFVRFLKCLFAVALLGATRPVLADVNGLVVYINCWAGKTPIGEGSGVVVSDNGIVLTAKHLVANGEAREVDPDSFECEGAIDFKKTGERHQLKYKGHSSDYDALLLQFEKLPDNGTGYAKFCPPEGLARKQLFAAGFDSTTFDKFKENVGFLSIDQLNDEGTLVTTAPMSPGMSGGPVFLEDYLALIGIVKGTKFNSIGSIDGLIAVAAQAVEGEFGLEVHPSCGAATKQPDSQDFNRNQSLTTEIMEAALDSTMLDKDTYAGYLEALKNNDIAALRRLSTNLATNGQGAAKAYGEFSLGLIAAYENNVGQAVERFEKAAQLEGHRTYLQFAAIFALDLGEFSTALQHASEWLAVVGRDPQLGIDSSEYARARSVKGQVAARQGQYDQAEKIFREILENEQLGGLERSRHLSNLAELLRTRARYSEAIELLELAIGIDEDTKNNEIPEHAVKLNNYAKLLLQDSELVGDLSGLYRAKTRSDRALEIDEMNLQQELFDTRKYNLQYADHLNSSALLHLALKDCKRAENKILRAQKIDSDYSDVSPRRLAIFTNNLGEIYRDCPELGKLQEADSLLEQAVELADKYDLPPLDKAIFEKDIAVLRHREKRYEKAEELFNNFFDYYEHLVKSNDVPANHYHYRLAQKQQMEFREDAGLK